jgi:V/A-type H+-transporting ATPase subunit I
MRWREAVRPVPMSRVAVVTPVGALRDTLVRVAGAGTVELDQLVPPADQPAPPAAAGLRRLAAGGHVTPVLAPDPPDLAELERAGRADLLAGEVELAGQAAQAVVREPVAALAGWIPTAELPALSRRLAGVGAAATPLPRPRGVEPPTAPAPTAARRTFAPLVDAYTTVPYRDLDPTVLAGIAYAVMFGAMFGDLGHGALLLAGALLIRFGRVRLLAALRPHWLFVAAAGLAAMGFGVAYGEFFGPTGLLPALWLEPMAEPVRLLFAGVGLGAVLLAGAFVLGTVNRVREGGWVRALYAPSGLAGSMLFVAAGLAAGAWYWGNDWLGLAAAGLAAAGLGLSYTGLWAASGGGPAGAVQAGIELFDLVIRLGANLVSFARLAAFGLTHAVLGAVVWDATTGLWSAGGAGLPAAVLVFLAGNAIAFALEALVAGVQALRLEYYELFSRVFQEPGRPFRPWQVATAPGGTAGLAAGELAKEESWEPG